MRPQLQDQDSSQYADLLERIGRLENGVGGLDLEARISAIEARVPRFYMATDSTQRNVSTGTMTEIVTSLRITIPPTTGVWELAADFQWEHNTANARMQFEVWEVGGSALLEGKGVYFTPAAGRNVRESFRAFITAASFGATARVLTPYFNTADGGTASLRNDVTPLSFTVKEYFP